MGEQSNQSILRSFEILSVVASFPSGVSAAEVARLLGMHKSTVSRMTAALRDAAALVVMRDGLLTIGPRLSELALAGSGPRFLLDVARPHLEKLASATGESVCLALLDGDSVRYVGNVWGGSYINAFHWEGQRTPLHCAGTGKVLLASFGPSEVDEYCSSPLKALTEHSVTDPAVLRNQLEDVRAAGYCWVVEEGEIGLTGIGAPITTAAGEVAGCVCLGGPTFRLDDKTMAGITPKAVATAMSISEDLGSKPIHT